MCGRYSLFTPPEQLAERPSFRPAFERTGEGPLAAGRCLVPADGFYEWVEEGGERQPYRVALADDRPFAMAGLWSQWRPETTQTGLGAFTGEGGANESATPDIVETFTIVTTEPNGLVGDLHHRMAAILPRETERQWLTASPEDARALLEPYPDAEMRAHAVSQAVNDPANDSPELVDPVEGC